MVKKSAAPAASRAGKVKNAAATSAPARPKRRAATPRQVRPAKPAEIAEPVAEAAFESIEAVSDAIAAAAADHEVRGTSANQEGMSDMKNQTNDAVVDRVQAIFGDVNERARTAFEKNAKIVEELTELTRGNVEAIVASTKVAARGVEALSQEAAEYGRKSFEDASSALRSFTDVKSAADLFRLQSEFAKSQFDSIVAESSKMSEAVIKLAGEMFEPIQSRYSTAAERVKNAIAA
jgi:phasin family protein